MMTEDQLEREALGWLGEIGYAHRFSPDIALDGAVQKREQLRAGQLITNDEGWERRAPARHNKRMTTDTGLVISRRGVVQRKGSGRAEKARRPYCAGWSGGKCTKSIIYCHL